MLNNAFLRWFTGKSLDKAKVALQQLQASQDEGCWIPKASRSVKSVLSKANVAVKLGRAHGKVLETIGDYKTPHERRGWRVAHCLHFGSFAYAQTIDWVGVRELAAGRCADVIDQAEAYAKDFAEIAALIARLDATRPKPVFTNLGVSPTVTNTLKDLGLVGKLETLRVPETKWELVEHKDPRTGKTYYEQIGTILWPAGTVHKASRYSQGTIHNFQCEACGHAIKNNKNWVPLLVDNANGVPHSLWVGRDCARNLFGIDVKGDINLKGSPAEASV